MRASRADRHHPTARWVAGAARAACAFVLAGCGASLAACGSAGAAPTDAGDASPSAGDAGAPVQLAPTSSAAIAGCVDALSTTFCSRDAAVAAASACDARVAPADRASCDPSLGCFVAYEPDRPGACVAGPTYPSAEACAAPLDDDCSFYRTCLEAAHPCGETGYALGFGEPICYELIARREKFTPAGQRWLHAVRTCLERAIAPMVSGDVASCDALADAAFASHVACYTAKDASFCELTTADLAALTGILLPYLNDPRVRPQIQAISAACADAGK